MSNSRGSMLRKRPAQESGIVQSGYSRTKGGARVHTLTGEEPASKRSRSSTPNTQQRQHTNMPVPSATPDLPDHSGLDHIIQVEDQLGPDPLLTEYLSHRSNILQHIMHSRGPRLSPSCPHVNCEQQHFRCSHCYGGTLHCQDCLLTSHQQHPFHSIEVWRGAYYARTTLHEQGYMMDLRHSCDCCALQLPPTSGASVKMTIVASTGIHTLSVLPCACTNGTFLEKLMDARLFPATFTRPQTAFTFELLDHYLVGYTTCKTTAYSFYEKLRRLSDPTDPGSLPVRLSHKSTQCITN
jgi:hypothetical protein